MNNSIKSILVCLFFFCCKGNMAEGQPVRQKNIQRVDKMPTCRRHWRL